MPYAVRICDLCTAPAIWHHEPHALCDACFRDVVQPAPPRHLHLLEDTEHAPPQRQRHS